MTHLRTYIIRFAACWVLWPSAAFAAGEETCTIIRVSDLGEADLVINTAAAAAVLETLGYEPQSLAWSQTKTFAGLADGAIDVFFGADSRKMAPQISALLDSGVVEVAGVNQTFAPPAPPPSATTGSGEMVLTSPPMGPPRTVASISDTKVAQNAETAETPDPADQLTPGMLTLVRTDFAQACPNVAVFLRNLTFPPGMSVFITVRMANEYEELFDAAAIWFGDNRDILDLWLAGVKTIDETDAKSAVLREFGY